MKPTWAEIFLFVAGTIFGACLISAIGILMLVGNQSGSEHQSRMIENADEIWEGSRKRKDRIGPRSLTR